MAFSEVSSPSAKRKNLLLQIESHLMEKYNQTIAAKTEIATLMAQLASKS